MSRAEFITTAVVHSIIILYKDHNFLLSAITGPNMHSILAVGRDPEAVTRKYAAHVYFKNAEGSISMKTVQSRS